MWGHGWNMVPGRKQEPIQEQCRDCYGTGEVEATMRDLGWEELGRVSPEMESTPETDRYQGLILRCYQAGKPVAKAEKETFAHVLGTTIKEVLELDQAFLLVQVGNEEIIYSKIN